MERASPPAAASPCNHALSKSSSSAWSSLRPIGIQKVDAFTDPKTGEDFPAYELALANCRSCDSTLAHVIGEAFADESEEVQP